MDNVLEFVANLGFPIGIALYLLIRMESRMESLSISIQKLTIAIEKAQK